MNTQQSIQQKQQKIIIISKITAGGLSEYKIIIVI